MEASVSKQVWGTPGDLCIDTRRHSSFIEVCLATRALDPRPAEFALRAFMNGTAKICGGWALGVENRSEFTLVWRHS